MLAILAMMLVGTYALNQNQRVARMEMNMIRNEVATIASGVGLDRLEQISVKAFDQATKEGKIASASELTPYDFPDDTQGDDVDDFHEASHIDTVMIGSHELQFKVYTTVRYAKETDPNQPVADDTKKTKYKRARASVHSLTVPLPDSIVVYQTYACGDRCDW